MKVYDFLIVTYRWHRGKSGDRELNLDIYCLYPIYHLFNPPGGSEWIISVGDYVNNSFTALGSSDHREVVLEL